MVLMIVCVCNRITESEVRKAARAGAATPEAAYACLQAAKHLDAAGRLAKADAQLSRALAFYRQVGAAGYLDEANALAAESA